MLNSFLQRIRSIHPYVIVSIFFALVLIFQANEIAGALSPLPKEGNTKSDIQIGLRIDEIDRNEIDAAPLELWEKSFVSKTNLPLLMVSLDYIYVSRQFVLNNNIKTVCFQELSIKNKDVENSPKQNLIVNEKCVEYDISYIPTSNYVILIYNVYKSDYRNPYFYPFDQRSIRFDFATKFKLYDSNKKEIVVNSLPSVMAVTRSYNIGENLWILSEENDKPEDEYGFLKIELKRLLVYKILVWLVIILVFVVIRNLRLMSSRANFFQVSTGIFLGLWGVREILIPGNIATITLVDTTFLILYLILAAFILYETITRQFVD